ncbi:unnamed protein product [Rhodiola kirilowii]
MAIVENGKVRFLRLLIAVDAEAFNTLVVLVVRMRRMGDKGIRKAVFEVDSLEVYKAVTLGSGVAEWCIPWLDATLDFLKMHPSWRIQWSSRVIARTPPARFGAAAPPPLLTTVDSAAAKSTAASTKSITAALKNLSLIGSTWKHVWSGTYYLLEIFKRFSARLNPSTAQLRHLQEVELRCISRFVLRSILSLVVSGHLRHGIPESLREEASSSPRRVQERCSGFILFYPVCSASFSTGIVGDDPVLVRDFIRSALYDPNHGYFSQRSGSVGVLEQSIRFNQLQGTCAKGILDYIMLNAPERIYNNMTYTSVEISPTLAERQLQTVGEVRSHLSKFNVERRDAADRGGWGNVEQQPCWVIMLEVMRALAELYKPLQDPLITRCADIVDLDGKNNSRRGPLASAVRNMWAKIFPKPRRCWLPTGCLKLMEVLHGTLPQNVFNCLRLQFSARRENTWGQSPTGFYKRKMNKLSDYSSYLDAKGDADIFFPTDFWLLERIDHHCSGWRKQHDNSATKKGKREEPSWYNLSLT